MNSDHFTLSGFRRWMQKINSGEFFWVILGQLTSAVGSLAAVRLLTAYLDAEAYGKFALGSTIALLVNQSLFGPLTNACVRYWSVYKENQQIRAFLKVVYKLVAYLSLVFVLFSIATYFIVSSKAPEWKSIYVFGSCFALTSGYISILNGLQLAERHRKIVAWHQGLSQWIQPLFAIILIASSTKNSSAAMLGYLVGCTVTLSSQLLLFRPNLKVVGQISDTAVSSQKIRKQLIVYAYPFASWGLITWMHLASDRWALQAFCGEEKVGFYTVLYQLGYQPITLAGSVLVQFIYPILFERAGDLSNPLKVKNAIHLLFKIMMIMVAVSFCVVIITLIGHRSILHLFAAPEYEKFSHLLPFMMLASTIFNIAQMVTLLPMMFFDSKVLLYPKIFSGVIGTLLNILLISRYGLNGAIVANIASASFYLIWILTSSWRQINHVLNGNLLV